MTCAKALAHDIEAPNADGITIYYNWIKNKTELAVTRNFSYTYSGNIVIPATVVYQGLTYNVTTIDEESFFYCSGLTSITIPNSVTSIGDNAFRGCSGLTSITIPNSVNHIGIRAFSGCSGITSIALPNSIKTIDSGAFFGCIGLTSITIPNSVNSISGSAFGGCLGLTSIQVESGNNNYDSRNNCNAIIDSNNQLILGCKNTIIPKSVTSIGNYAFYWCRALTSITIPNNVTSIGDAAFTGCTGLVYITLPSNLSSLENFCFGGCINLTYIYCNAKEVPSANGAFDNTRNITLYVPSGSVADYKNTLPWSKFNVQSYTNSQSTKKCSKPTISISDGEFVFNCETPNVQYHWIISTSNGNTGDSSSISQSVSLNVFATKDDYLPSDVATYVLSGLVGDVDGDGKVNVVDHVKLSDIIMNQNE